MGATNSILSNNSVLNLAKVSTHSLVWFFFSESSQGFPQSFYFWNEVLQ